jgi:hypothetical protein
MNYTQLPPQVSQHSVPHFDACQFDGRRRRFLQNSSLDFKDFRGSMHTVYPSASQARPFGVPAWSQKDSELRETVVSYLERRLGLSPKYGTILERLARCRAAGKKHAQATKEKLNRWLVEYRNLNKERFSELDESTYGRVFCGALRGLTVAEQLRRTELQLKIMDSEAFLIERGPELVLATAYLAYRMGWNSTSIAERLTLKPPAVRQVLARLNRTHKRLEKDAQPRRAS